MLLDPVTRLVRQGNIGAVRELLSTDRTLVNRSDGVDRSPLHYPAWGGEDIPADIEMAKLLLSHGALVNIRSSGFHTPLHLACITGRKEMCELLLTNGARYDLTLDNGRDSALHLAHGLGVVKALIR